MKKRLVYIDQLKGIAILLVVIGHFIEANSIESHPYLFSWIYAFHMPLFMFITGYVSFKTIRINTLNDFLLFVKNRGISLLIPYFFWPLVVSSYFFTSSSIKENVISQIVLLATQWSPLWFLWYAFFLLLAYALFYLVSNRVNKKVSFFIDVLIFLLFLGILGVFKFLHLYFPVEIDSFTLYFLFFFLGIFVSKFNFLSNLLLNRTYFSFFILVFILLSGRYVYTDLGITNKVIKLVISVTAIASLYFLVNKLNWNELVDKYVQLWGRNTIVIYTTHFTMLKVFTVPVIRDLNLLPLIIVSLASAIIIISACMLIRKVIEQVPLLNLLLYGYRSNKPILTDAKEKVVVAAG